MDLATGTLSLLNDVGELMSEQTPTLAAVQVFSRGQAYVLANRECARSQM
ncbi:hypothetical protein [Nannocystis pusilla]